MRTLGGGINFVQLLHHHHHVGELVLHHRHDVVQKRRRIVGRLGVAQLIAREA